MFIRENRNMQLHIKKEDSQANGQTLHSSVVKRKNTYLPITLNFIFIFLNKLQSGSSSITQSVAVFDIGLIDNCTYFFKTFSVFVSELSRLTGVSCPRFARLSLIEYRTFDQHFCSVLTVLNRKLFAFLTVLILISTFPKFFFTYQDLVAWIFEPYIFLITCYWPINSNQNIITRLFAEQGNNITHMLMVTVTFKFVSILKNFLQYSKNEYTTSKKVCFDH